jgi:cell fate (sporulation/competence/biofilm development) regulator YlbF (YheA/YmcA/DUF963 family)
MSEQPNPLSETMQASAHTLGQSLSASEPFTRYVRSQLSLDDDSSASDLLEQLIAIQNDFRRGQAQGTITQEDIEQLKAIQGQAQEDAAIMEYAHSQQMAIAYQKEIIQTISQQLGMDFALIAKRSCA